jgi:hypothetical protein
MPILQHNNARTKVKDGIKDMVHQFPEGSATRTVGVRFSDPEEVALSMNGVKTPWFCIFEGFYGMLADVGSMLFCELGRDSRGARDGLAQGGDFTEWLLEGVRTALR